MFSLYINVTFPCLSYTVYRRDPYHPGPGDQRVGGAAGRLSGGGQAVADTAV